MSCHPKASPHVTTPSLPQLSARTRRKSGTLAVANSVGEFSVRIPVLVLRPQPGVTGCCGVPGWDGTAAVKARPTPGGYFGFQHRMPSGNFASPPSDEEPNGRRLAVPLSSDKQTVRRLAPCPPPHRLPGSHWAEPASETAILLMPLQLPRFRAGEGLSVHFSHVAIGPVGPGEPLPRCCTSDTLQRCSPTPVERTMHTQIGQSQNSGRHPRCLSSSVALQSCPSAQDEYACAGPPIKF
jgi:hypothetical protein